MSHICENCGLHFHGAFTPSEPIVRQDAATGYVYLFCSEECADFWFDNLMKPPRPPLSSIGQTNLLKTELLAGEMRQGDRRLRADGQADHHA